MIINERTFKDAYNDYFEIICRFLNYYTRDYQVIEEVVQDVFVCLWEDYEGKEIQYIKTFLYNSARNRMLNYLRDEENHTAVSYTHLDVYKRQLLGRPDGTNVRLSVS